MISHRNHLGVLTADAYILDNCNVPSIDLTTDLNLVNGGSNGIKTMNNNYIALFAGDCNGDGQIQNIDRVEVIDILGGSGLSDGDIDMNGQIQNIDLNLKLIPNLGKGFQSNVSGRNANTGIDLKLYAKKRN